MDLNGSKRKINRADVQLERCVNVCGVEWAGAGLCSVGQSVSQSVSQFIQPVTHSLRDRKVPHCLMVPEYPFHFLLCV